jgi:ectoine hydroxylase-related dioxygenase (phytanoyl-CoA dioxygenase family)
MEIKISKENLKKFDEDGFLIFRKVLNEDTVKKAIIAYEKIRKKCENYEYPYFRKFKDIAINDIYGIEHIFHEEIFSEDIFNSIMESQVLELSRQILCDEDIFLSRNRIHCTKSISHSGNWHRDGGFTGSADDIDLWLKKSQSDIMWVQATLPYFHEDGFYIVPGSHKFANQYIPTKDILGTKKILKNEIKLELFPGDLIIFNPFTIHRGTCVGRIKKQRAHLHMRFARKKYSKYAERYKGDSGFFKNPIVLNCANDSWKKSLKLELDDLVDSSAWYGEEIVQEKDNLFNIRFYGRLLIILKNRVLYYLSSLYPFSQRSLENFSLIKYPYLKENKFD